MLAHRSIGVILLLLLTKVLELPGQNVAALVSAKRGGGGMARSTEGAHRRGRTSLNMKLDFLLRYSDNSTTLHGSAKLCSLFTHTASHPGQLEIHRLAEWICWCIYVNISKWVYLSIYSCSSLRHLPWTRMTTWQLCSFDSGQESVSVVEPWYHVGNAIGRPLGCCSPQHLTAWPEYTRLSHLQRRPCGSVGASMKNSAQSWA